jgi:hypothetical protein
MYNIGLAQDQLKRENENNAYMRLIEQQNRNQRFQERGFAVDELNQYKARLVEERSMMIDRQIKVDKAAAQQRADYLEQFAKNQTLAKQERDLALREFRTAQAIARGERDEDLQRYYTQQVEAEAERKYAVSQYESNRGQQQLERNQELARRNDVSSKIEQLRDRLSNAQEAMGPVPAAPRAFTEQDISAEEARRAALYQKDVDRAADRVASIKEADLIRGGVDISTAARSRRADITSDIAHEYEKARAMARDEALKYIGGVQATLGRDYETAIGRRKYTLGETEAIAGSGIENLLRLPNLPTAVNSDYARLPTSVFNRSIQSANNYQAPLGIRSSILDFAAPTSIGNQIGIPSAGATAGISSIPSAVTGPAQLSITSPNGFMSTASNIGNNLLSTATQLQMAADNRAGVQAQGAGRAFQNLIGQAQGFGKQIDGWWGDRFGSNSPVGSATLYNSPIGPNEPSGGFDSAAYAAAGYPQPVPRPSFFDTSPNTDASYMGGYSFFS